MKQLGFTLVELMIVVAIIGILAAISYPSYQSYVERSGRADGIAKLMEIMQAQERYASTNQTYTADVANALGYGAEPVPSNERRYNISADDCPDGTPIDRCVLLTAVPAGAQANDTRCGTLTLDNRGTKGENGTLEVVDCW